MNTSNYASLWVAEYNPVDGNFHIQPLEKTITGNLICIAENRSHDYLLFGIFDTHEQASAACNFLDAKLKSLNLQR